DDDWGIGLVRLQRAELAERRVEPAHADREPGRRHRLAAEAGNESVVAPAAADRTEADGPAVLVGGVEGELGLEHETGIIFETADDRRVDAYAAVVISRIAHEGLKREKLLQPLLLDGRAGWQPALGDAGGAPVDQAIDLVVTEACAAGAVGASVLAAWGKPRPCGVRPRQVSLADGARRRERAGRFLVPAEADRLHHAVEDLAVADPDDIVAAGEAERLHR